MPPQQISPSAARRSPWSFGDLRRLRGRSSRSAWCCLRILLPIGHARGGVDAHDAVGPDAEFAQLSWRCDRPCARRSPSWRAWFRRPSPSRRTTPARRPSRRRSPSPRILSASALDAVVVDVDVDVRVVEEEIHAIELHAVDLGLGGEVEHGVEVDARFGAGAALADEAGPHGVVKFRKVVAHGVFFRADDEKRLRSNAGNPSGMEQIFMAAFRFGNARRTYQRRF